MQIGMAVERGVFAIVQLDDRGNLHEVDANAIVEGAGDRRAGNDEDGQAAILLDQRMRDGPAAAQVTQPERVVAVHEDACVFEPPHGPGSFRAREPLDARESLTPGPLLDLSL